MSIDCLICSKTLGAGEIAVIEPGLNITKSNSQGRPARSLA